MQHIKLTEKVFNLISSSYNLKNRYVTKVGDVEIVNTVMMNIENSTIGFIAEILKDIVKTERQFMVGKYPVDLYLPDKNIVIECDEFDHRDYDIIEQAKRTAFIESQLNCKWIRYDPCTEDFDFPSLINIILKEIIN